MLNGVIKWRVPKGGSSAQAMPVSEPRDGARASLPRPRRVAQQIEPIVKALLVEEPRLAKKELPDLAGRPLVDHSAARA